MGCRKTWIFGALCGALLCGPNSQAGSITFVATGIFNNGLSFYPTYVNGPAYVEYTYPPSQPATVPPPPLPTPVSLGTITTSLVPLSSPPTPVSSTLTLTVYNISTGDFITFVANLGGAVSNSGPISTSGAFCSSAHRCRRPLMGMFSRSPRTAARSASPRPAWACLASSTSMVRRRTVA